MNRIRACLIGLAAGFLSLPALAQAGDDGNINIAGQWTFTANIGLGCDFGGTATLTNDGDGLYSAELTARQSCPEMLEEDFLVRQECTARVLGEQVSLRCTIAEFINGYESPYYYPDNFTLTISSPNRMYGALVSSGTPNPAEWRRAEGGIS